MAPKVLESQFSFTVPGQNTLSFKIVFCFFSCRYNFHVSNHPGWLKVSPLTRYAPALSPSRSPPAGAGLAPGPSQTLKPVLCRSEGREATTAMERRPPLPSEGGVARVEVAAESPMREVAEAAVVMVVRPVATLSPGEPRAPLESVRQIYSEHNYCRLVL